MRVEVNTPKQFIESVSDAKASETPGKVLLRIDTITEGVKERVGLWATAVVNHGETTQYVIELGLDCGMQGSRNKDEKEASKEAELQKDFISRAVEALGLATGPGKWELF